MNNKAIHEGINLMLEDKYVTRPEIEGRFRSNEKVVERLELTLESILKSN